MSTLSPIRFSQLKWMARSPAHYRYYMDHPSEPSKSMRLGAAVDALVFGHKPVPPATCNSRRDKAWAAFAADNPDAVLLTRPEYIAAQDMADSLSRHKQAMEFLTGYMSYVQKTLRWEMDGRECSGTPDCWDVDVLSDLKSGVTSDPLRVPWQVLKFAYHAQLDWYGNAITFHNGGRRPKRSVLVFVEQTPPHVVTIFEATEADLLKGHKLWRLWFERLLVCEANDSWPGYCESVVPLDLPNSEGITLQVEGEEMEVQ